MDEAKICDPVGDEMRTAPRISLMLRAAKLSAGGGEYLCILRDVSATGLKARLFHPLPAEGPYAIELGTGESYPLELVWERDSHAGFRFTEGPIDLTALVDEAGRFPKRQLRLALNRPVVVTANAINLPATLANLSQHGALIELDFPLALRQLVQVGGGELPVRHARVLWRRGKAHGLVFSDGYRLDELAQLVARLQNPSQKQRSKIRVNH